MRRSLAPWRATGLLLVVTLSAVWGAQEPGVWAPPRSERVERLLSRMGLDEKIGQMSAFTSDWAVTGPSISPSYLHDIRAGRVGAIFNAYTAAFTRKLQRIAVEDTRLGIPLLFGYDVIHGHKTIFPIPLAQAASFDLEAIERSERIAATEAAAMGLHWTFSPMVDIARDPRWGRIAEGAGEDVHMACEIARARVRGFQGRDLAAVDTIMACAKHFAAYGAPQSGRDYNTVDMSRRELLSTYLPPFRATVEAGVSTVMSAFNELDGVPCTGNSDLLTGILKGSWAFGGFVVTDYTSINEMVPHGFARDVRHAAQLAASAGVDMDLQGGAFRDHLRALVLGRAVPVHRIDDAARRVLWLKERLGLLDDPYRYCDPAREARVVMAPEHLAFARRLARESIVLLKNRGELLPLSPAGKTIAVVGPLADDQGQMLGSWSAAGEPRHCVTVLSALKARLAPTARIVHAKGCSIEGADRSGFSQARQIALAADVVVAVMGESADMCGEAASRSSLDLPGMQRDLLRVLSLTGRPIVLVLMNGRPLTISWEVENLPAVVEAWFLGTQAGHAVADVLLGEHNPSGRLPVTFPRSLGQVPIFHSMKNTGRPIDPAKPGERYTSRYLDVPTSPLFPFGYGLSYSRFEMSRPRLDTTVMRAGGKIDVAVDVKNLGPRDGIETVQLYLQDPVGSVTRPVKELKRFARVSLKAGQTRTVHFTLDRTDLAFFRFDMTFGAEPGEFRVHVGPNAEELKTASFELVQ